MKHCQSLFNTQIIVFVKTGSQYYEWLHKMSSASVHSQEERSPLKSWFRTTNRKWQDVFETNDNNLKNWKWILMILHASKYALCWRIQKTAEEPELPHISSTRSANSESVGWMPKLPRRPRNSVRVNNRSPSCFPKRFGGTRQRCQQMRAFLSASDEKNN